MQGRRETIDIIRDTLTDDEFKGFLKGNCIKYLTRYKFKNGIEDLNKAVWYLNKLIATEQEEVSHVIDDVTITKEQFEQLTKLP